MSKTESGIDIEEEYSDPPQSDGDTEEFSDDSEKNEQDYDDISVYKDLITEMRDNRVCLDGMLGDVSKLRSLTDKLIPEKLDFKQKFMLEERMKTVSTLFGVELDIRKQKEASIKSEFELRKKLADKAGEVDKEFDDIAVISKALEKMRMVNNPTPMMEFNFDGIDTDDDD